MTLADIKKNWAAWLVIIGIVGGTVYGWNYLMDHVAEAAETQVKATLNAEMIEGAKKAAADAVKEQLPAIAKQVAKEVAAEVVKQQKEEAAKKPN